MKSDENLNNELETLYFKIHSMGQNAILSGKEHVDPNLSRMEHDRRLGLTLLIEIKGETAAAFCDLERKVRQVEPNQYYYPASDFHITVLDFIAAHEGFVKDETLIKQTVKIIEKSLHNMKPFDIRFKGIALSDAAILAKGYYESGLMQLRRNIRRTATQYGFDLKERYQSLSAHSTIVRFSETLKNREEFLAVIDKHQDFNMGIVTVNRFDLVIHDWYNRKRELMAQFSL